MLQDAVADGVSQEEAELLTSSGASEEPPAEVDELKLRVLMSDLDL